MKKVFIYIFVIFFAIILVTVGIDASDHFDNFSESIIGKVFFKNSGPCPVGMVFISSESGGFCIDKYESSASSECPYQDPQSQSESRTNLDYDKCMAASGKDARPWRYLSQSQAAVACAKAGKRLPTNSEWYQASLGTPDIKSDWGNDDCQVNKNWNIQPGNTGAGSKCFSSFGVYDMIGNVWEWVKGEANDGVLDAKKLPGDGYIISVDSSGVPVETNLDKPDENYNNDYLWMKSNGSRGIARGGYWDNQEKAGFYAMYLVSSPSFAGTGIGFRCAK